MASPNVILNEMSDSERESFVADYNSQGPAGRPAGIGGEALKS